MNLKSLLRTFAPSVVLLAVVLLAVLLAVPVPASTEGKPLEDLTIVFQKQKNPDELKSAADAVGAYLSAETGMRVKTKVPSDYSASVQALVSKTADAAYVSSLPFLLARRDGHAHMLLAEQRPDAQGRKRTDYDSVFVVRKDSPLTSVEDLVKNAKKTRLVFTSPTSASGYIFAYSRLVDEKLLAPGQDPKAVFKEVHFGGGYTQAVEEVIQGRADVAAVSFYVVEGSSTAKYLKPEQLEQVRILGRTPGVPTHLVAVREGLPAEVEQKLKKALLKLSAEKPELLKDVYGAARFVEVDENKHLAATIKAVERIKLPIERLQ